MVGTNTNMAQAGGSDVAVCITRPESSIGVLLLYVVHSGSRRNGPSTLDDEPFRSSPRELGRLAAAWSVMLGILWEPVYSGGRFFSDPGVPGKWIVGE